MDKVLPEAVSIDNYINGVVSFSQEENAFYAITGYISAHKAAQVKVCDYIGHDAGADTPIEVALLQESCACVEEAKVALQTIGKAVQEAALTKQVASRVLTKQRIFVEELMQEGLLDAKGATNMLHEIAHDLAHLTAARKTQAKSLHKATAKMPGKRKSTKGVSARKKPNPGKGSTVAPAPEDDNETKGESKTLTRAASESGIVMPFKDGVDDVAPFEDGVDEVAKQ